MTGSVTIPARFNGPPDSANGGFAAGAAAAHVDGTATVTLRRPPPLETAMPVSARDGKVLLTHGDETVVEVAPDRLDLEVPAGVGVDVATEAAKGYPGFDDHAFPTCFVCGPRRPAGDGLEVYSGPIAGQDELWAAPWTPDDSVSADGAVRPEVVWAALDCPGYFAVGRGEVMAVLGRITSSIDAPVRAGEPHVALSWPLGRDGRKLFAGSALLDADGAAIARARSTWIVLRDA